METVNLALLEVYRLLSITNDTFHGVCLEVEAATSKDADNKALRRLNGIIRMFLGAAPAPEHDGLIRKALGSLPLSKKFALFIVFEITVREAIKEYKSSRGISLLQFAEGKNRCVRMTNWIDSFFHNFYRSLLPIYHILKGPLRRRFIR